MEINEALSRQALAEAEQAFPEFAGLAVRVLAKPLFQGYAWQVEWEGPAPSGQPAWEFQNTATRAYRRLAGLAG